MPVHLNREEANMGRRMKVIAVLLPLVSALFALGVLPGRAVSGRKTGTTNSIAAGFAHSCAIVTGGQVRCWGSNDSGQLGDGTTNDSLTPVTVQGLSGVVSIAAQSAGTCALLDTGQVFCWGSNVFGELGDGTQVQQNTPVAVQGVTDAIAIAAGFSTGCAIVTGGAVKCWGSNFYGQLGDGSAMFFSAVPVVAAGVTGATSIATGAHTCAVILGGRIKCWGKNDNGELGDGTTVQRRTPVAVSAIGGALRVAAGSAHTCAIRTRGEVSCWGSNSNGQLGDGTSQVDRLTPVDVIGVSNATAIAAGFFSSCALTAGGTGQCWGWNVYGQLGDGGANTEEHVPVTVSGSLRGTDLASGSHHMCAAISPSGAACWGFNGDGQLGDGTYETRYVPVSVIGLS